MFVVLVKDDVLFCKCNPLISLIEFIAPVSLGIEAYFEWQVAVSGSSFNISAQDLELDDSLFL